MNFAELYVPISIFILFIIVAVETIILLNLRAHYNKILKGNNDSLISVLEGIQKALSALQTRIAKNESGLSTMQKNSLDHVQKLVVRRFNPFSNTGGDQSFILGLLDGNKNGVVITSLHSRENTRFYIKTVEEGVGVPHPLSDDEKMIFKKGHL